MAYRRTQRPEDAIQRAVFKHIAVRGVPNVVAFHVPNGGKRNPIEAAILKGLGVVAGVPDVLIVWEGKLHALELKNGAGKLSVEQRNMHALLHRAGVIVATAYGLDHAILTLETWGVLRGRADVRAA